MTVSDPADNRGAARRPDGMPVGTPFPAGNRANPGGKPRKLREIEDMLDAEFRTVEGIREAFTVLRKLATHGATHDVYYKGEVVGQETEYSEAYMALYLNRLLGPIKEQVSEEDLSDLSDDALNEIRTKLRIVK